MMVVKIDGRQNETFGRDFSALVRFLKENTHGGKVDADVEIFKAAEIKALKEIPKQVRDDGAAELVTECRGFRERDVAASPQVNGDEFHWVMSSFDVDRDDERIDQSGWQLENYLKNPVVLWSHDYKRPAIGYAKNVRVDESGLCGDIVFNGKDVDEFGYGIGQRVKAGAIRAGSVGFRVEEIEFIDSSTSLGMTGLDASTRSASNCSLIYRKQELLEFSICNVPANPFALHSVSGGKALSLFERLKTTINFRA